MEDNTTSKEPTSNTGVPTGNGDGDVYWPLVLVIAILGTLLVVVCVVACIWSVTKLCSIKKITNVRNQWSVKRVKHEFPPQPRNGVQLTEIPAEDARENVVQIIPNIQSINQTGASASLGYKNNPVKEEIPCLMPPNTWTPSPPLAVKNKSHSGNIIKEKCGYFCEQCGKEQKDGTPKGYTAGGIKNSARLQQMLRAPHKQIKHYGRHGLVGIPHKDNQEYNSNCISCQTFPVYDVFEDELRSSNTNKLTIGKEMGRNSVRIHKRGTDRRSRMPISTREAENYINAASKRVAESLGNYSLSNDPMSSSTVSTSKLVDRSTQTERKFIDFFEKYGKFEPDSRPSLSWDNLTPAPHLVSKTLPPKTRGYSVPSAAYLG